MLAGPVRQKRCTLARPDAGGVPIRLDRRDDVAIVRVTEHLDDAVCLALAAAVSLAACDGEAVVLDLRECCCCDSGALVVLMERKRRFGGRLQIALAPAGRLHRTFNVTGTLGKLDVCWSLDEAVERHRAPSPA